MVPPDIRKVALIAHIPTFFNHEPNIVGTMKITREFATISIIILTEILGWSLILPFLPYYALEFGASPLVVGFIISTFSIFQFISAPIIGKLSDRYGRKPLLIISQFSTFMGFMILGFANSLWMILLSRIVDGLFGSNMTLSNAYVTDITKGKDRAKAFGYLGAVFGIGFFIGPAIGGFLALVSYALPSFIAAGMSLVTIFLIVFFLRETVHVEKEVKLKASDFFPMKDFLQGVRAKELRNIFLEFFIYLVGFTVVTSTLALYVDAQLGLGPEQVGLLLMIIGGVRVVFQMTLLPKLINRFDERPLIVAGMTLVAVAVFSLYFVDSIYMMYMGVALFSVGAGITRPMVVSVISKKSGEKSRGKVMGVADSLGSIARIIGPIVGGYVIGSFYPGTLGLVAGALILFAVTLEVLDIIRCRRQEGEKCLEY
jgi:DHA1 family tetracycline resistance protein-like MFS transporter